MIKLTTIPLSLFAAVSLCNCTNYDTQSKNDAATGALIGAGAGALIGDDDNRAGSAAVGAALGGAAGYAVGSNR